MARLNRSGNSSVTDMHSWCPNLEGVERLHAGVVVTQTQPQRLQTVDDRQQHQVLPEACSNTPASHSGWLLA